MARAELLGAFALTEPHAGSDAANINTRAELRGDKYILRGQKIWITHGGEADVYIVMAVTEKGKGAKGVSSFIVEKGTSGLAFGKRERPMGLPHHTREVFFEDCEIPRGNLIGREGEGFKVAMTALDSAASPSRRLRSAPRSKPSITRFVIPPSAKPSARQYPASGHTVYASRHGGHRSCAVSDEKGSLAAGSWIAVQHRGLDGQAVGD
jgi:hypothetical protein